MAEGGGDVASFVVADVCVGSGFGPGPSGQVVESGVGGATFLVLSKPNLKPPRSGSIGA